MMPGPYPFDGEKMRVGVLLGIVLVIILAVTLWKRGKPPVP